MQCFGVLLAVSFILTVAVLYVLSDSHLGRPPPYTHIQRHDHQIDWQQLDPSRPAGLAQPVAAQLHWQRLDTLQSEGIERAERINEQMMRQRYRDYLERSKELREPLVPSSLLFPDGR
jgi:hypothetical protein